MNGGMKFEDAFHARLQLIKPTLRSFAEMEERHPAPLSPGVQHLVHTLHRLGKHVYFVSGGMKQVCGWHRHSHTPPPLPQPPPARQG